MKRVYLIAALLGVLGAVAAGIIFFSPQYRAAHYASLLNKDLKKHPVAELLNLTFPDKTERTALSRAAAEVWLEYGYDAALYRVELTVLHRAGPLVAQSMPFAAPQAVTGYMQLTHQALERLAETAPEACRVLTGHGLEGGVQDANMALVGVMSAEEKESFYNALAQVILTARRNPDKIKLNLNQAFDFIRRATQKAVARMGAERAQQSLTATPEETPDPCLLQGYILKNLLEIDDAYRGDVLKIQMLRGPAGRSKKPQLPAAEPSGVPPGNRAPGAALP